MTLISSQNLSSFNLHPCSATMQVSEDLGSFLSVASLIAPLWGTTFRLYSVPGKTFVSFSLEHISGYIKDKTLRIVQR